MQISWQRLKRNCLGCLFLNKNEIETETHEYNESPMNTRPRGKVDSVRRKATSDTTCTEATEDNWEDTSITKIDENMSEEIKQLQNRLSILQALDDSVEVSKKRIFHDLITGQLDGYITQGSLVTDLGMNLEWENVKINQRGELEDIQTILNMLNIEHSRRIETSKISKSISLNLESSNRSVSFFVDSTSYQVQSFRKICKTQNVREYKIDTNINNKHNTD